MLSRPSLSFLATTWLFFGLGAVSSPQPAEPKERYLDALKLLGVEQYELAVEAFQEIIAVHPDFGDAYKTLSETYVFTGDHAGARSYFGGLLGAHGDNAYAHYGLAQVELKEDNLERAIEHLKRSIALDPSFAPAYGHAGGLAEAYAANNDVESALAYFQELLARDPRDAYAYYGLGCSYRDRYEWDRALQALDEAIRLEPNLTSAHREQIAVYGITGRYRKLLEASATLLSVASRRVEPAMVGYATFAQANAFYYLGDYGTAIQRSHESLRILAEIGDMRRLGNLLNNLANLYDTLGDDEKVLELRRGSLDLARKMGDRSGELTALTNMGHGHLHRGELELARASLEESLELARAYELPWDQSYVLINLAATYGELGEKERAFEALQEALSLSRGVGDDSLTAAILSDLGQMERDEGNYAKAKEYLEESLEIANRIGDVEIQWRSRGRLGFIQEALGDVEGAIAHFADTISIYDAAREKVGIDSLEVDFVDENDFVFPRMVQLLAESGRYEEAFLYAEKYKAASLVRLLSKARGVVEELLPESMRSRLEAIEDELEALHAEISEERIRETPSPDSILKLERQVTDLALRRGSLIDELRREHPSYYRLTHSEPPDVGAIRARNLAPKQTLVEYIVGTDTLAIFVLTQEALEYRAVSVSRKELERMLAELSPLFQKDKPRDEASRRRVLSPPLADFSIPPARALYDVLIEPVMPLLEEDTDLIIVPDDVLSYLPFELLVVDANAVENPYDFANATFLLERFAVSYAASASLLDPDLTRPREPTKGLLAFGNPDFERREEDRLAEEYFRRALTYSGGVYRGSALVPLPSASAEVSAIGRIFPDSHVHVGASASERTFKEQAGAYRVLHLATHFLSDDRQPLYSKIVLAQEEGSDDDGYLQTYEIFNARLNADLAVLSACNTGLGKLSRGEGLLGAGRAFLYAGVPSLVVSLWSVDDEATSVLMQSFYEHLREGASKTRALRSAKLDYLAAAPEGKRDPFYWAPFILIGNVSPLDIGGPTTGHRRYWIAAFVAMGILSAVFAWRRRSGAA